MPPTKKTSTTPTSHQTDGSLPDAANDSVVVNKGKSREDDHISVEDLNLPRTIIQRLAKGVLPPNTNISKDAVLAMSKSATVFVNFLASQANEQTMQANRRIIQPEHVLAAISDLELESFAPRLRAEFEKYSSVQSTKRSQWRQNAATKKKDGDDPNDTSMMSVDQTGDDSKLEKVGGDARPAKRSKLSTGTGGSDFSPEIGSPVERDKYGRAVIRIELDDDTISDGDGSSLTELDSDTEDLQGEARPGREDVEMMKSEDEEDEEDEALDNGDDSDDETTRR